MFGLGTTELIIILVIIMMFFGLGKLPKVAGQLGAGVRSFKDSMEGKDGDESGEPARLEDQSNAKGISDASLASSKEVEESAIKTGE